MENIDLAQLKREILGELKDIGRADATETQPRKPREPEIFERLSKVLEGVTTPELEFVLGSENILAVENQMMRKFNEFLFTQGRAEFAKHYPDICQEYVNTAIKNKEEYARINVKKIQDQATELEKERSEKAELQKQLAALSERLSKIEIKGGEPV